MRQKDYLDALKENKILKEQKCKLKSEEIEESENIQEFGFAPRGSTISKMDARQGFMTGSIGGVFRSPERAARVERIKRKAKIKALPKIKKRWAAQAKKEGKST